MTTAIPSIDGDCVLAAKVAVVEACRRPLCTSSVHRVAERLCAIESAEQTDDLLQGIRDSQPINRERLAELARWICQFGPSTGQLRVAIAILGIAGSPRDADLVKRLGRHEQLTATALVALRNLLPHPSADIVELLSEVLGTRGEPTLPPDLARHVGRRGELMLALQASAPISWRASLREVRTHE